MSTVKWVDEITTVEWSICETQKDSEAMVTLHFYVEGDQVSLKMGADRAGKLLDMLDAAVKKAVSANGGQAFRKKSP